MRQKICEEKRKKMWKERTGHRKRRARRNGRERRESEDAEGKERR